MEEEVKQLIVKLQRGVRELQVLHSMFLKRVHKLEERVKQLEDEV